VSILSLLPFAGEGGSAQPRRMRDFFVNEPSPAPASLRLPGHPLPKLGEGKSNQNSGAPNFITTTSSCLMPLQGSTMTLFNQSNRFGFVNKLLHWAIFILVLTEFTLIYWRGTLPKSSDLKSDLMLYHKSFGFIILCLTLCMLIARHIGKRPNWPNNMPMIQQRAAKLTHILLYVVLFAMPLSGITMSTLSGYPVSVFNWFTLPKFLAVNKDLAGTVHTFHVYCSYFVIALASVHTFAALYHHFVKKDQVLKRMLFSR